MRAWTVTQEDIEISADQVKVVVLAALVRENLLAQEQANAWAEQHTVIVRKTPVFRALLNRVAQQEDALQYIVVGLT